MVTVAIKHRNMAKRQAKKKGMTIKSYLGHLIEKDKVKK